MSTPTHVPDRTSPLPCHTPSQANRSTCVTLVPPHPNHPGSSRLHIWLHPSRPQPARRSRQRFRLPQPFLWVGYTSTRSIRGRQSGRHPEALTGHAELRTSTGGTLPSYLARQVVLIDGSNLSVGRVAQRERHGVTKLLQAIQNRLWVERPERPKSSIKQMELHPDHHEKPTVSGLNLGHFFGFDNPRSPQATEPEPQDESE